MRYFRGIGKSRNLELGRFRELHGNAADLNALDRQFGEVESLAAIDGIIHADDRIGVEFLGGLDETAQSDFTLAGIAGNALPFGSGGDATDLAEDLTIGDLMVRIDLYWMAPMYCFDLRAFKARRQFHCA